MQVHKELPCLRITSDKDGDVPFIELRSSDGNVLWAVGSDGNTYDAWHNTENLANIRDQVAHSLFTSIRSVYCGSLRIFLNE